MVINCEVIICDATERTLVREVLERRGLEVTERPKFDSLQFQYVGFASEFIESTLHSFSHLANNHSITVRL